MKFFAKNNFLKKIVIIFALLTTVNFAIPEPVKAESWGGELMEPVCDLLVGIGDGVINVCHRLILGQEVTLLKIDTAKGFWRVFVTAIAVIAAVAVVALATWGVGLAVSAIATAVGATATLGIGSVVVLAVAASTWAGVKAYNADFFPEIIPLPLYNISPEEIFKNEIAMFNVNFFDPEPDPEQLTTKNEDNWQEIYNVSASVTPDGSISKANQILAQYNLSVSNFRTETKEGKNTYICSDDAGNKYKMEEYNDSATGTWGMTLWANSSGDEKTTAEVLSSIIASWYVSLRMIATVGMMSVLVYIGIRILLSSTSSQKAKYKQLLVDWLIGMVLLFVMHYIMVFANKFVEKITDIFDSLGENYYSLMIEEDENGKIEEALNESGFQLTENYEEAVNNQSMIYVTTTKDEKDKDVKYYEWKTNLMGRLRFDLSYAKDEDEGYIGYTVLFLVLVFYTVFFIWTYIKRVIYMAFLTLIAPLVALTYPIDKANDGKAQGFNIWFKEYIFNLLIQPVHLLLYTILVTNAMELATKNLIYAIVAIGFMVPAEKLLRKMFNFSKAETPGAFGGAAGAALTMSGLRWLMGRGPKGGKATIGGKGKENKNTDETPINPSTGSDTAMKNVTDALDDGKKPKIGDKSSETNSESGGTDSGNSGTESDDAYWNLPGYGQEYDDESAFEADSGFRDDLDTNVDASFANGDNTDTQFDVNDDNPTPQIDNDMNGNGQGNEEKRHPIKMAFKAYGRGMEQKFARSIANADPIRTMSKVGLGVLGAGAFGITGLALGVTSGDAENAFKYGGAGVAGGYKLGSEVANSGSDKLQVDGVKEAYEREKMGEEEYQKRRTLQQREKMEKDEKSISTIQQKFKLQREQAEKKWKEMVEFYGEQKITDLNQMVKIEKAADKFKENGYEKYREKAVAGYALNERYSIGSKVGVAKRRDTIDTIGTSYNVDKGTAEELYNLGIRFNEYTRDY